ncbi:MAG: 50S ribosomal protein L6 [Armatimonadota bacterium]
MSRIGKMPIPVPGGVKIQIQDNTIIVEGPKGTLTRTVHPEMSIKLEESTIIVERPSDERPHRALHGLTRSLVANMVEGVTTGFQKTLQIQGVGYRATMNGLILNLQVGYSHTVDVTPRPGIEFEVGQDTNTRMPFVIVRGIDKQVVGQQAAEVRAIRKPEPYKGKGIRYSTEVVRRKAGKSGKAGSK